MEHWDATTVEDSDDNWDCFAIVVAVSLEVVMVSLAGNSVELVVVVDGRSRDPNEREENKDFHE